MYNLAIDNLVREFKGLEWIPCSQITGIPSRPIDNVYYAIRKHELYYGEVKETLIILLCIGSNEECSPLLVRESARIYSLLTEEYNYDISQFKRYSKWLLDRNKLIQGFTEYENNYYMVAHIDFNYCYSRYGFCTVCGILRCSSVWCICGHNQLDEFIKKSQLQGDYQIFIPRMFI